MPEIILGLLAGTAAAALLARSRSQTGCSSPEVAPAPTSSAQVVAAGYGADTYYQNQAATMEYIRDRLTYDIAAADHVIEHMLAHAYLEGYSGDELLDALDDLSY